MKIDTKPALRDYSGQPMIVGETAHSFERVITWALNNFRPDEIQTPADKTLSFLLSCRIATENPVELSVEDAAYIKARVAATCSPLELGRVTELLEGTWTESAVTPAAG